MGTIRLHKSHINVFGYYCLQPPLTYRSCTAGKYICVSLFLAVMLEAFEAKYDGGIGRGDGTTMGSRIGSMLNSFKSKMSSLGNSAR